MVLEKCAASAWRLAGSVFTPVSENILRMQLKSHTGHVSVIAVYTPTNEAGNEEETKKFYQSLQECVSKIPKRDMLLVMGDFNARVGNDSNAWQDTIGRFGPEKQNGHGVKLLDFCAFNSLVVTNTLFQHRSCQQQTVSLPYSRVERTTDLNSLIMVLVLAPRHTPTHTYTHTHTHAHTHTHTRHSNTIICMEYNNSL